MPRQPRIAHNRDTTEYRFREGCFITEWWNSDHDPEASVARARVEPGGTTRWHRLHGITERYVILEGRGRVELGEDEPVDVRAGDVVGIPPGMRQRIHNHGDTDLVFLAVCTPRFREARYEDVDPAPAAEGSGPGRGGRAPWPDGGDVSP